jgi:hypothetical protein
MGVDGCCRGQLWNVFIRENNDVLCCKKKQKYFSISNEKVKINRMRKKI